MNFLVDHNLERQAIVLLGNIANQGWLEIIPIRFVTFKEMELPADSSDRFVWQVAVITIGNAERVLDERDYRDFNKSNRDKALVAVSRT